MNSLPLIILPAAPQILRHLRLLVLQVIEVVCADAVVASMCGDHLWQFRHA